MLGGRDAVDLCTAFNIYYERDPIVNPVATCPNSPSLTNIKFALWDVNVITETAETRVNTTVTFTSLSPALMVGVIWQ